MKITYIVKQGKTKQVIMKGTVEIKNTAMDYLRLMTKLIEKIESSFCEIQFVNEYGIKVWNVLLSKNFDKWGFKTKQPLNMDELEDTDVDFKDKLLMSLDPTTNTNTFYAYKLQEENGVISKGRANEVKSDMKVSKYLLPLHYVIGLKNGFVPADLMVEKNANSQISPKKSNDMNGFYDLNKEVEQLIKNLYECSRQVVVRNYDIKAIHVSEEMIKNAKDIINQLYKIDNVNDFNTKLKMLYIAIPRKMNVVSRFFINSMDQADKKIDDEANLLKNLELQKGNFNNRFTSLESFGFTLTPASAQEVELIKLNLNHTQKVLLERVFRIESPWQKQRFDAYIKNNNISTNKLLWHGSRTENFLSILKSGLQLNPNAQITGKMFGDGIYFASSSDKSFGYTSFLNSRWANGNQNLAYMMLCETAYGSPCYTQTAGIPNNYDPSKHNCLHAKAGVSLLNDEIIFYHEEAILPKYFVEFSC